MASMFVVPAFGFVYVLRLCFGGDTDMRDWIHPPREDE